MALQSEDVVHEPPRPRETRRRRGRGLVVTVGALGLVAVGALGATLASRYLGGAQPVAVATAPTPSPTEPPTASAPAAAAEVVLSPEAVTRAGIKTAPAEVVESQAVIQLP